MTKSEISYIRLFKWFLIEEWQMYETLFGSKRLYLFPVIISIFGLGFGISTPVFNVSTEVLGIGFLFIISLFGIQTGSVGFEAKDSISNLLGENSRILSSSRYLPINRKRLISVFILKDVLFYSSFILLPVVVGIFSGSTISPFGELEFSIISFISFYILTVLFFIFGMSLGFVITILSFDKISQLIVSIPIIIVSIILYIYSDFGINYIVEIPHTLIYLFLSVSSLIFITLGLIKFRRSSKVIEDKNRTRLYSKLESIYPKDNINSALVSKFLVDLFRSPGGIWKIIFSSGMIVISGISIILIVNKLLIPYEYETYPVLFSTIISLTAYPIYTMIFRYDELDTYENLPISKKDIIKSKFITYLIISIPIIISYYAIMIIMYPSGFISIVIGFTVIIGMLIYQFGILARIVKDKPLEFLFDGVLFSTYSFLMMSVMIPVLIVGMYGQYIPSLILFSVGVLGIIILIIGLVLTYKVINSYN